jgi:mRNA-degrading endonuclease RelE of RelBE toxin-antitoxin system
MKIQINYQKPVEKFLSKNHFISRDDIKNLIIKALLKIIKKEDINIDLKALKGEYKNLYRIRKGDLRIIFYIKDNNEITIIFVKDIDFRGNIY